MSGFLNFDIDLKQLREAGAELQASEKQIVFALNRALRRTASTLRTMSARGLKNELQLRTLAMLRKRLKSLKVRSGMNSLGGGKATEGVQLWYGLNEMPASWFKGRARKTSAGASKRGHEVPGGFIRHSRFQGRQTIFKREGAARLPITEQNLPIEDKATVYIEDNIFDQTEDIFWRHFMRDLRSRVSFSIGER